MPTRFPNRRQVIGGLVASSLPLLPGCASDERMPDSRFELLDGSVLTHRDLNNRVVLVNFWATTCVSCVKEMPALVNTYQTFAARGYDTIAVAMSYDQPQWVRQFAKTRQLPFKVAFDQSGQLARDWGDVKLTPTSFLVNREGLIVKRYVGEPDFQVLHQLLDGLLGPA